MSKANGVQWAVAAAAIALFGASAGALRTVDAAEVAAGNIAYLNGGVSQEEADAMRAEGRAFPLEVMLAQHRADEGNAFVADAKLRILDSSGREVMNLPEAGPILLARLPDGRYTVEATFQGQVKRQQVNIAGGRHQKVGFLWNAGG